MKSVEDRQMSALVESVIGLGRKLSLAVVAEGVETEHQLALLLSLACPVLQGYLFARALPAAQVSGWIRSSTAA